jgi:hypothetical protein
MTLDAVMVDEEVNIFDDVRLNVCLYDLYFKKWHKAFCVLLRN